jgi:sulfopropanediol 3-dehydrogenase
MRYLKKATQTAGGEDTEITAAVAKILQDVENGGEQAARDFALRLDRWDGDIVVTAADRERATARLPQKLKDDIAFAHDKVRRFADAQRAAIIDTEIELMPGLVAGHRNIPVATAGCAASG